MEILNNFNYSLIGEIYNLGFIFVSSFVLHYFLFIWLLKGLAASSLQAKLSYLLNNYLFIAVPILFSILFYLYINNPIYLGDESEKVKVTFAVADVQMSAEDAHTVLFSIFRGSAFIVGSGVAAACLKGSKMALLPRLGLVAGSGTGMATTYHAVHTVLNTMTAKTDKYITVNMKVDFITDVNNLKDGNGLIKKWVSDSLNDKFSDMDISHAAKKNLSVAANSISEVEASTPSHITSSTPSGITPSDITNGSYKLNVTISEGEEAMDKVNNENAIDSVNSPLPASPPSATLASREGEALDSTPSDAAQAQPSTEGLNGGGSWPASSPLEQGQLLDFPHKEEIITILSLNLTLLCLMLYFIFMLFLFITARLLFDSNLKFNIIKKLPYGDNLHYYFLKYITLYNKVNSFWLYFIICNLFFLNVVVIFCLYNIIYIIQPG